MRVESDNERRAALDEPGAGVGPSMNSAAMALRVLEGAFLVEVVGWDTGDVASDEKPRREALHRLSNVEAHGVVGRHEGAGESREGALALVDGPFTQRVEGVLDLAEDGSVVTDFGEGLLDEANSAIDAAGQALEQAAVTRRLRS